jgi:F-type H+-transporting ATPase subunit b
MAVTPEAAAPAAAAAQVEQSVELAAGAPAAAQGHAAAGSEHKTQGLPQFDTTQWAGQAVWFLIIFGVVLALMRFVFVPRISGAIAAREGKIEGDIAEARRLKSEADAQAEAAAAETAAARAAAQKLGAEARARAQAEIAARMAVEEAKIAETTAKAEAGINAARDAAMGNVRGIAIETAQAIVGKLTGRAATAKEVDAAVAGRA